MGSILPIGDMMQAGATAANGILSYIGTRQTNKTNRRIAAEQNALNYKMFQESNAYNYNMWNLENWYNSPEQQRKRLQAAGYNPAALIDAPQLGAASSPSGSVTPVPAVGYQFQSPISSIGPAMAEMSGTLKNLSEAKLVDKQAQNFEMDLMSQIDLRESQGLLSKAQADWYRQEFDLREANWEQLIQAAINDNKMKQEEARKLSLANDLTETYGDELKKNEVAKTAAEVITELERGNTEKAHQTLMRIQGDQEKARTIIQRDAQRSQAALNSQQAAESRERQRLIGSQKTAQDIQNEINREFGKGSAAAKFLIDYYDGKLKEPKALEAEWEKVYRDSAPGQIGAILKHILEDIIPLHGVFR